MERGEGVLAFTSIFLVPIILKPICEDTACHSLIFLQQSKSFQFGVQFIHRHIQIRIYYYTVLQAMIQLRFQFFSKKKEEPSMPQHLSAPLRNSFSCYSLSSGILIQTFFLLSDTHNNEYQCKNKRKSRPNPKVGIRTCICHSQQSAKRIKSA